MESRAKTTRASYYGTDIGGLREVRRRGLPIRSESLTQLASGEVRADATIVSGSAGFVYYASVRAPAASTFANLDAAYTGFVIPLSWDGRFVINGEDVCASSIYMPVDDTLFQVYGSDRITANVALPRDEFAATIAALQGIDDSEVRLGGGSIEVPPELLARVKNVLVARLNNHIDSDRRCALPPGAHDILTDSFVEAVADLYLHARPARTPSSRAHARLGSIVRKAEERFEAAQSEPVSLADLCAAAGVSQGTLHNAFMAMYGDSPMACFKKRRLTDARLALMRPKPNRRLVKSAALGAGFTHLGRFSAEYQALFGELPTTTLNRSSS